MSNRDLSKMNIILADTSSQVESVALMRGRQLLGEKQILRTKGHAPGLLLDIEQILSENQMKIQEIDAFVCGVGPGSFTGIRVGMTSLKTLAYALKKPIYAVSTIHHQQISADRSSNTCQYFTFMGY